MTKKVIITGSSGMVGRGVLLECLESDKIKEVLVINRSSIKMEHPKLKEKRKRRVMPNQRSQLRPVMPNQRSQPSTR